MLNSQSANLRANEVSGVLVAAYLECPRKAYFLSVGTPASDPELERREVYLREHFVRLARNRISQSEKAIRFDYAVEAGGIRTTIDAVEIAGGSRDTPLPIRFITGSQIAKQHRILLAFDAAAIAAATGRQPRQGQLIFGEGAETARLRLTDAFLSQARHALTQVMSLRANSTCPELILRKHCTECLFRSHCRSLAVAGDDLSLIGSISAKERSAAHGKGIFTVTQLSHTFRLRRNRKAPDAATERRHAALTALAIREKRTYVLGTPSLDLGETPVFLDVEGIPECRSHYLIGMCVPTQNGLSYQSFWADDAAEAANAGRSFVEALRTIGNPTIIHYGKYEKRFMQAMAKQLQPTDSDRDWFNRVIETSVNILATLFKHFYFPVYSNSLKEIAGYLGYRWTDPTMSGPLSVLRRLQWQDVRDTTIKQQLLDYNRDDCQALAIVARKMCELCSNPDGRESLSVATAVRGDQPYHKEFFLPEFEQISKAAYWDHQRDLVYVRPSPRAKRQSRRREKSFRPLPNRIVEPLEPNVCLRCGHHEFRRRRKSSRIVYDIKLARRGVSRDVVRYVCRTVACQKCGEQVRVLPASLPKSKYGDGFLAFVVYGLVELCLHHRAIDRLVGDLLGFGKRENSTRYAKSLAAKNLRGTYDRIRERIRNGRLAHADETPVRLKTGHDGYVWVLTNLEDVYFFYQATRESAKVKKLLEGFRGVLVSDFYCGYDAIPCSQQKCLIHLMRDLNDDLLRQPFDEELKELGNAFATLLQKIIRTVDEHGLVRTRLERHKPDVSAFYEFIESRPFSGCAWLQYKDRFHRNRDSLFTFLSHDGIPWNNNNAEHAIRAFGRLRDVIDGMNGEQSIEQYLVLLSISVTCKYKGIDLLGFLRSGSDDIDAYIAGSRKQKRPAVANVGR